MQYEALPLHVGLGVPQYIPREVDRGYGMAFLRHEVCSNLSPYPRYCIGNAASLQSSQQLSKARHAAACHRGNPEDGDLKSLYKYLGEWLAK